MQRVHRAKCNDKEAQEQRAAEQAQRDQLIEEAKKVYTTFSELPLEIVVDVRSFTITHLAEPEGIVLPDSPATVEQQLLWRHLPQAEDQQQNLTVITIKSVRLGLQGTNPLFWLFLNQINPLN